MEDIDRCEEELIEYAIRESIRDVSIDRYSENGEDYMKVLFAHPAKSLSPLPDLVYPYLNSIPTVSGDYLRIVTAIEQGRTTPHRPCLSNCLAQLLPLSY